MTASSLHMMKFALSNPAAFTLDPDGPIPFVYRLLTAKRLVEKDANLEIFPGKTILIVGASSGCGLECARILSKAGCHLIITARNESRANEVLEEIREHADNGTTVEAILLDAASFESLHGFSSQIQRLEHLDMAILNAGVYRTDFNICPGTGWEETIQVNFISTYILSLLVLPLLLKSPEKGRLLLVSSEAHAFAGPKQHSLHDLLQSLNAPDKYACYDRYHISKLLVVLWVQELCQRLDPEKALVAAVSPGYCHTGLFRDFNTLTIASWFERVFCRTAENGACEYVAALGNVDTDTVGRFFANGTSYPPSRAARSEIAGKIRQSMCKDMADILPESISALLNLDPLGV